VAFPRRLRNLLAIAVCATAVIWARVAQMQWLDGDSWAAEAQRLREHEDRPGAPRGSIVDRDGVLLAHDVPELRLAFVGWDWLESSRVRCDACGAVLRHRPLRSPPRRCSCRTPGHRLVPMPPADLAPLERALAVEPGTLARAAAERVAKVAAMARDYGRRLAKRGEESFFVDDKQRYYEEDLLNRPYVLKDIEVSEETARLLELDAEGRFHGFRLEASLERRYPQGDAAPQLIGYTQPLFDDEYVSYRAAYGSEITPRTRIGRRGLERAYDGLLRGHPGYRRLARDAEGALTIVLEQEDPEPGMEVRLTASLDAVRAAEAVLDRHATREGYGPGGRPSGAFVAMHADDGSIVAWGEAPRFHLETDLRWLSDRQLRGARFDATAGDWMPSHGLPDGMDLATWREQLVVPEAPVFSRVAQVPIEPGSTFKPFIALAMMRSGGLPWPTYECVGGPGKPACHHAHGWIDLVEALSVSCNCYFSRSLRDSPLWSRYRTGVAAAIDEMGFGRAPFVDLLDGPRNRGQWLPVDPRLGEAPLTMRPSDGRMVAIGQGRITTTPLHLARAMALFANGGRLVMPHVVGSVGGKPVHWPAQDLDVPEATLQTIRAGLRAVTRSGTARALDWDALGVTVYGKTGTAQVAPPWRPGTRERYLDGEPWHHWFVGFAEAPGQRTLVFACVLHSRMEPSGSVTAAPAAFDFLQWWYGRT
jgi:penicillin-binding protein 2